MKVGIAYWMAGLMLAATPALADGAWVVQPQWVAAHEAFLASDALRGRESASPDEAIAAAYVAGQYQAYGLTPPPGMTGYVQTTGVIRPVLDGHARLVAGGRTVPEGQGLTMYRSRGNTITGKLAVGTDPQALPDADIVLIDLDAKSTLPVWATAATAKGVKLLIVRDGGEIRKRYKGGGSKAIVPAQLSDLAPEKPRPDIVILAGETYDGLAKGGAGQTASLEVKAADAPPLTTSNALGWLAGSDPDAGVILVTAHLDHLGVRDGVIYHGANDDASGVTAVLELAHALAGGPKPKRSVLFVCYGSEEMGLLGSQYFARKPAVPLDQIIANLEIEMIGQQDPKMAPGVMMMTGFDRSDFGAALKAKGALVAADLYPEQHFFERSDNYQLALQGIVAHTISGWAVTPTYHDASDDIAHLDLPFMTQAIQSLVEPLRWLAGSDFVPQWRPGGKP